MRPALFLSVTGRDPAALDKGRVIARALANSGHAVAFPMAGEWSRDPLSRVALADAIARRSDGVFAALLLDDGELAPDQWEEWSAWRRARGIVPRTLAGRGVRVGRWLDWRVVVKGCDPTTDLTHIDLAVPS